MNGWPDLKEGHEIFSLREKLKPYFTEKHFDLSEIKTEQFLKRYGNTHDFSWVYAADNDYPEFLKAIYDPPPVIFHQGPLPRAPGLAIVGTRNIAPIVRECIFVFVSEFKKNNPDTVIVSGFARGVDFISHLAAVENHLPTAAVLASGIFYPSPASSREVLSRARKKQSSVTLLSEFAPDTEPVAFHFPRRNRIIAGLSGALVVMQAPEKSGALISARFALEEGRDVYVFDHELLLPPGFNEGGRKLLEDGADFLKLNLEGRIFSRKSNQTSGKQMDLFEKKISQKYVWIGGDYFFNRNPGKSY